MNPETVRRESASHPILDLLLGQAAAAQPERHVLGHRRHHDLRVRVGEAEPDQPAHLLAVALGVVPVHGDGPAVGDDQPVQQSRERGLAGAVGTDDPDPVLAELDRDVVQDGAALGGVGVADAVDGDQRHDSTTIATPWPPPTAIAANPSPPTLPVRTS